MSYDPWQPNLLHDRFYFDMAAAGQAKKKQLQPLLYYMPISILYIMHSISFSGL